jgi:hypothetical protein
MKKKNNLILIVFALIFSKNLYSQEILSTSGDEFTTSSMQLSWTLGETMIETYSQSSIVLTQGFHQGILNVSVIEESNLNGMSISAFPNPASDWLNIKVDLNNSTNLTAYLYSAEGKLVKVISLNDGLNLISLADYSKSTYYLNVLSENKVVKSFKIVKE